MVYSLIKTHTFRCLYDIAANSFNFRLCNRTRQVKNLTC